MKPVLIFTDLSSQDTFHLEIQCLATDDKENEENIVGSPDELRYAASSIPPPLLSINSSADTIVRRRHLLFLPL